MTPEELFRAVLHGPVGVDAVQVIAAELAAAEERGRFAAAVVCKCGDELQRDDGAICGACLQPEIAEAEERGRRAGIEEAAKWMRKPDADQMRFTLEQKGFLARRGPENEPDFLAAMDEVRDDLKRKGVKINTVEMLTELYEGRGHSHEEALRMARGEPDLGDRK